MELEFTQLYIFFTIKRQFYTVNRECPLRPHRSLGRTHLLSVYTFVVHAFLSLQKMLRIFLINLLLSILHIIRCANLYIKNSNNAELKRKKNSFIYSRYFHTSTYCWRLNVNVHIPLWKLDFHLYVQRKRNTARDIDILIVSAWESMSLT